MRKLALGSVVLAALLPAFAAVETTTVNGKVVTPDGAVATAGTITATLSQAGSASDGGTSQRVGGRETGTIGADGTVTGLVLVPNDAITPTGTYYLVTIAVTTPQRAVWTEKWSVTTSPDPVNVGAITRLEVAPGISVPSYSFGSVLSGTNTAAAMVVGTGASLSASGSGTVAATTAAALAADPANCSAGEAAGGVTAGGVAESCVLPLRKNATTVTVCASGCDFTGIQAALDGTTSSASAPVQILVMPGTFNLGASGISVDAGTDSYKSVIGWSRNSVKLTTGDNTTHTFYGNTASFASADLIQFRVANMTIEHTTDSSAFEFQCTADDHRFEVFADNLLIIGDNQPVLMSASSLVSQASEPSLFVISNSEMVGDSTGMSLSNALVTYSSNNLIRRNTTTAGTAVGFTGLLTAYSYAGSALYSTGDTIRGYYYDTSSSATNPTSCVAVSLGGGPETVRISGMSAECSAKSGFTGASYGAMVMIGQGVGIGRETGDAIISDSTFTYTATSAGQGMYGLWMNGENDRVTLRNVEFRRGWGAGTETGFAGNSSTTGSPTILLDRVSYDDSTLAAAYRVQSLVPTVQYVQLPASQSVGLPATGAAFDVNNEFRLFDAAADENASWRTIRLPESLEVPSLYAPAFKLYWRTATATTGNVVWRVGACIATGDDPWPCTVSSFTSVTASAVVSVAGDLIVTSGVLPSGVFSAGNRALAVQVQRDADNGSDTMTGDAELVAVEISYPVR